MLSRHPRLLRGLASWLLIQTSTQLLWPSISYALTAGPTAPEATSFEPVDTTDMVNLASGDLAYNIPLLEVPGPEGGYPLSLAYHAGIQPDVEASWVGLGWSLNPGAINRSVNGYADDQLLATQTVRDYWQGGNRQTVKVGVGVGLGDAASVSAGLTFSNDTYRGFAVGEYVGVGVGVMGNSVGGVGVSASYSRDGYGNASAGIGIGVATHGAVSLGASVGVSTNFSTISANAGAGLSVSAGGDEKGRGRATNSLVGASISTDDGHFTAHSLGGSLGIRNATAGRIQTQSNGFDLDIPIPGTPVYVSLGYNYTRYWSDEINAANVSGALYYPQTYNQNVDGSDFDLNNQEFDTYRVHDPAHENTVDNPDPDWTRGGSLPNYDNYMVVAQGLGGSMRPYAFQEALYSRHRLTGNSSPYFSIKDSPLQWNNNPMCFRFENDFSNAYLQENAPVTSLNYTFGSPTFGNADGNYGYDAAKGRLAGSKHIEYYTNAQLLNANGHAGFVDTDSKGFDRAAAVNARPELAAQIGGFSITNASGVTYHFALPAYAYEEYARTESTTETNTYNALTKNNAYAYTWFLTAVTGPDYVDRNSPGVDASDWGYWVKFSYGMWSDHYRWRNPALGYRFDVDAKTRAFSQGRKEVYYLNSITTRSHTALFEKELRFDDKGTTNRGFTLSDTTRLVGIAAIYPTLTHEYPANSLRLKRIILLNNNDVPASLESTGFDYNIAAPPIQQRSTGSSTSPYYYEQTICSQFGQNVFDSSDSKQLGTDLGLKSVRTVVFEHDYSLMPNTPNSIDNSGNNTGRLTLKSLNFLGTRATSVMPATKFEYELDPSNKQGSILLIKDNSGNFTTNNIGLIQPLSGPSNYNTSYYEAGDILQFTQDAKTKYLTILDLIPGSSPAQYHVRYLSDISTSTTTTVSARVTKNPPYLIDYHDWWGMFKSDFNTTLSGQLDGIARRTTAISNKAVDAWSLRSISSPLGSKISIDYEGDQYYKPVLARPDQICKVDFSTTTNTTFNAYDNGLLTKLTPTQAKSVFYPGQQIIVNGLAPYDTLVGGVRKVYYKTIAKQTSISGIVASQQDPNRAVIGTPYTNRLLTDGAYSPDPNLLASLWPNTGFISLAKTNVTNAGGGVRVRAVTIKSGNQARNSQYNYTKSYSAQNNAYYLPSGVTSYEPGSVLQLDASNLTAASNNNHPTADEILDFKKRYTNALFNIFAIARDIPAPGVMYEAVAVKDNITRADGTQVESPNSWTYRFKVFQANMIGHVVTPTSEGNNRLYASTVSIKDYTSRVGSMVSATRYGAAGRKLSETVNHFLYDDLDNASYAANSDPGAAGYQARLARFNYQGIIQESFADSRDCLSPNDGNYDHKVVMTKRDVYPSIQTSTTTTDYLTGLTSTSETLGFDFYSGMATRTATTDGYGNRFMTEVIPAYRKYPVMGLKVAGAGNRQMLSQVAASTTYKVDANNSALSVAAASAQTWSDQTPVIGLTDGTPEQQGTQTGIWRPWQSFSWLPTGSTTDGLTPMSGSNSFTAFDFTSATPPAPWKLIGQTTLYNPYSNALEAKDINGNSVATKLGFSQSKVLVSGGPAAYQELAYSGAEESKAVGDYFSGAIALTWAPGSGSDLGGPWGSGDVSLNTDPAYVHTGKASLRIGSYKHGFSYLLNADASTPGKFYVNPTKPYRVSVWTNNPGGLLYYWVDNKEQKNIAGTAQQRTADGWYLLDLIIPPIGTGHTTLRVGCYNSDGTASAYFDDFRLQPLNAQVASYVYDQLTGQVTDILDNNNLFTHYDYTSDGKLRRVTHETFRYGAKKIAEHTFHLAGVLDAASLTVDATGLATVTVPEAANPVTIQYDPGDSAYRPLSTAAQPYTFSVLAGTNRWVRVRVQDGQGNVRELVKHLN